MVMDPIGSIKIAKDTSFAMLLEAQRRCWKVWIAELGDLRWRDGRPEARRRAARLRDDPAGWFEFVDSRDGALDDIDLILMRKDPPVDAEYLYATHWLDRAKAAGCRVYNDPQSLRDWNEKLATSLFPQCCAPTLVSRCIATLREFVREQGTVVLKPLDGMGGVSVFRVAHDDPNLNVILETLTANERRQTMAQRYIEAIRDGDKRILLVDGEPVPYALARLPAVGEARANLAVGGRGIGVPLGERDRWICAEVAAEVRARGLIFVGLDVIGDYLTEINITSPTCVRELDAIYGLNIAGELFDRLEQRLAPA